MRLRDFILNYAGGLPFGEVLSAPASVFFLFIAIVFFGLSKMSRRWGFLLQPSAAYLALGAYFSVSLFHLFVGIPRHSPEEILTGAVLAAAFLYLAFRRRQADGS